MPSSRSKHRSGPAADGEAARPKLRILLANPRGFCAGVTRAIAAVDDALAAHGAPVYVRRPIVHNLEVVRSLEARGAIFVEELDDVPDDATVLFSAHGVPPQVTREADRRGLRHYDAVCPLVAKVHREVERHQRAGRKIILIGHQGHPEIEGTLGHLDPGNVFVVNALEDVDALPVARDQPVAYAVQTTYSIDEAGVIVRALERRFADLAAPSSSDICYATTNRQRAIADVARLCDAVIVVGERFSSNARRLAEVASAGCGRVQLIAGPNSIDWSRIPATGILGLTAAASTPSASVDGILSAIGRRFSVTIEEIGENREAMAFKRLAVA